MTGEAQMVYRDSHDEVANNYGTLKAIVLDRLMVLPETQQHQFWTEPGARAQAVAQCLKDWATHWVMPASYSPTEILESVLLEQYLDILPTTIQTWACQQNHSTVRVAVQLTEDFMAAGWSSQNEYPRFGEAQPQPPEGST